MALTAPVGQGAANHPKDVALVQQLLNLRVADYDMKPLRSDGVFDRDTARAIRNFQIRTMGLPKADGKVSAVGKTMQALEDMDETSLIRDRAKSLNAKARLSGKAWFDANQHRFPNSHNTSDLSAGFQSMADNFIGALRKAGAMVTVSATLRNKNRAWLMHHAWKIAHGTETPSQIAPNPDCDIIWDHGDPKLTKAAAKEMVIAFGIAYQPSLTSNHIRGTAIDMTIEWSTPITVVDAHGKSHAIDRPRNGNTNALLHTIGNSFGVKKLLTDPPHWSFDGH